MKLAINSGIPLRDKKWPVWPVWDESADKLIHEVAQSGRWSVRGSWTGSECMEQQAMRLFAEYNGCSYSVMTTSGSEALLLALEAMDIGPGDEVIVPALTWIAPATSILNSGAVPVLTDINPETTCIDTGAIKKAISRKTKAIMPVHLHCSIADMDEIMSIAREYGLFVIEDCSQAHGAVWDGKRVGTMGHAGVFSLNQEKVLTCGEGGVLITNNPELYDRLFRIKTDGCALDKDRKIPGDDQLIYDNRLMGSNYCASEFQAAVLISQLKNLSSLNEIRRGNAKYLDEGLSRIPGLIPLKHHKKAEKCTYYEYAVKIDRRSFSNKELDKICNALSCELGFSLHPTDVPIYRNKLFSPWTRKRYKYYVEDARFKELSADKFPGCENTYDSLIVFHHSKLLSGRSDMDDIISAFEKVQMYSSEI
ncbi:L-glutamine:2-deoxy-scyllo-inosose/3-amino-2,3-dideoxy-scyllo-inosose aminotransferase [Anaerobacterium chartisolvens]|uniref:L-glutamine:2-deoxy-scyllo-inosose/3-amino-2, 3-dideoxy-scyllo-inosose aminotransferase n=1 Tax=Anaerobacterium chartisolvens TaxID=1297424 RepID=A0A369ASA7_9FIRM|nr:DegT/DnrJ/EryC1/StrS family aminotransferase [Anaerobacterium chartisolvens]RCX11146.1 L-glutamine:2-deoxy-scyllo-inosose/3-amino-2,3-dideoxy-scyllo-inosose aminotransferase [Anaerobacterium chartisolvens]